MIVAAVVGITLAAAADYVWITRTPRDLIDFVVKHRDQPKPELVATGASVPTIGLMIAAPAAAILMVPNIRLRKPSQRPGGDSSATCPAGITVRQCMIAVVIAGIVLGASVDLRRRKACYYRLAWWHLRQVKEIPIIRSGSLGMLYPPMPLDWEEREKHNEYYRAMEEKYWYAFDRPWLPVAPDPPEPK
ncbi:MAG: hypothetical protein P4L84_07965 [Isosphaeraceae bacterium]|nr:hypothetical protein [Isosphaeraceae bacterium]